VTALVECTSAGAKLLNAQDFNGLGCSQEAFCQDGQAFKGDSEYTNSVSCMPSEWAAVAADYVAIRGACLALRGSVQGKGVGPLWL
jgi:hypothetical protein